MFTYSGGKGSYIVWEESDGEVRSFGTMSKDGARWVIQRDGSEDVVASGVTRDKAIADLVNKFSVHIIDAEMALQALAAAVDERGKDFVYRNSNSGTFKSAANDGVKLGFAPSYRESYTCLYEWKGRPSCGVALALTKFGMTIAELRHLDSFGKVGGAGSCIRDVTLPSRFVVTPEAIDVFTQFQLAQDNGRMWGTAYALASDVVA